MNHGDDLLRRAEALLGETLSIAAKSQELLEQARAQRTSRRVLRDLHPIAARLQSLERESRGSDAHEERLRPSPKSNAFAA